MSPSPVEQAIELLVVESPRRAVERALTELTRFVDSRPDALVSFATGETFRSCFRGLEAAERAGDVDLSQFRATHLDEFVGYEPADPAGFAHELLGCAPLRRAFDEGRFVPVPSSGDPAELRRHEAHLSQLGGVDLQFLGIGDNGHLAFCEPGTDASLGYHRTHLASATRAKLEPRFAPQSTPTDAVTAGLSSILAARRIILVATGAAKAQAVRGALEGEITVNCPASFLRRHSRVLMVADSAAASQLRGREAESAADV